MMAKPRVVISCEHGGSRIPGRYRHLFAGRAALLESHRGWDPGALVMARALSRGLRAPLFASTTSRLLVDLNRKEGITIVMVTHEPDMAAYAKRVIHFRDGLIASDERNGSHP